MPEQVSVALCTFNGAEFIERQIQSILSQGDSVAEIVVADDGSTDDTLERVRVMADANRRSAGTTEIRVLDGVGGNGVTKNFERAIVACRSELIVLSDQDDVWRPNRLAAQLAQFETRPELTFLHADARLVDRAGDPLGSSLFESLEIDEATRAAVHAGRGFDVLLHRNIVTGATVAFRRSLLEAALPLPPEWVHDEWLAVVASIIGRIDLLEVAVTDYRLHGGNEIGVRMPTLRNKVRRVLQPRGSRNRDLAVRSRILLERAQSGQLGADARVLRELRGKSDFEKARAEFSDNRVKRILPVWRLARAGGYSAFASQGHGDILRDLLQPA